jgi:chemotaxis protein methyltransferase CheR
LAPEAHYLRASILQEQASANKAFINKRYSPQTRVLRTGCRSCTRFTKSDLSRPRFVLAHFSLGNLMLQCGKAREAAMHFSNALRLLQTLPPDSLLPHSEGISASHLAEIIAAMTDTEAQV